MWAGWWSPKKSRSAAVSLAWISSRRSGTSSGFRIRHPPSVRVDLDSILGRCEAVGCEDGTGNDDERGFDEGTGRSRAGRSLWNRRTPADEGNSQGGNAG